QDISSPKHKVPRLRTFSLRSNRASLGMTVLLPNEIARDDRLGGMRSLFAAPQRCHLDRSGAAALRRAPEWRDPWFITRSPHLHAKHKVPRLRTNLATLDLMLRSG